MHMKTGELVDIAEGARTEASAPHLAVCEPCRAQLHDLRAMLSAARDVDVPEPSPLFWDHLSSRVSDAVAADARLKPSRSVFGGTFAAFTRLLGARAFRLRSLESDASFGETRRSAFGAKAVRASALVAAGLLVAVVLSSQLMAPSPAPTQAGSPYAAVAPPPPAFIADANAGTEVLGDAASDDASLMLVASLTSSLDLDAASDAGLAPSGSAEHAVTHMSDGELRELGRLLKEELARSGA